MRILAAAAALFMTGPCLWLFFDLVANGPTSQNVPMTIPVLALYALWLGAAWLLQPQGEPAEVGCLLGLASIIAFIAAAWAANQLPVPSYDGRPEEDGSLLLLVTYYPWLLFQFLCFSIAWNIYRAARWATPRTEGENSSRID